MTKNSPTPQDYNLVAEYFADYAENQAITEWLLGYPNVADVLEPLAGKRIMDYGCGAGRFSHYLSTKGAIVTGIDKSSHMIDLARSKYGTTSKFVPVSSDTISDLEKASFDAVVMNFVTCTIPTKDELINLLKTLYAYLKQDGICIQLNQNWETSNGNEFASYKLNKYENLQSGQEIELTVKYNPPIHLIDYFWSQEDYRQMFSIAGFVDVQNIELSATKQHPQFIDEAKGSIYFLTIGKKAIE